MPRGDYLKNMTPAQKTAHMAKMRAARKPKVYELEPSAVADHPVVAAPQPVVLATPSELRYMQEWKGFLNEYLTALSGMNGLGIRNVVDFCRMCEGGGIHSIGCACVCHRARKSLQAYANEFGPKVESV